MSYTLPNFMIVGAAKSGTTALSSYLMQHPEIYLSPLKEPKFISSHFIPYPMRGPGDDFIESFTIRSFDEYKKLFRRTKKQRAVGEASVENLYYFKNAIPLIKHYFGDIKIIIILRDPVSRAFSAYKHLLRDSRETLSFEEGLDNEDVRMNANWEFLWHYKNVGLYSEQVKAYTNNFSHVKISLFDQLQTDARSFIQEICRFLKVDDTFAPKISTRLNASGIVKSGIIKALFKVRPSMGVIYKFLALRGISDSRMFYLLEKVRHRNMQRIKMNPATRHGLNNFFRKDIIKTQNIIDKDLSSWLP